MGDKVTLKKGGKLVETYWYYDEEKEEGEYLERDLTHQMFLPAHILFERNFEFEEGLTLRDVLLYMNHSLDYWDTLLQNWCKEYVTEGLKPAVFDKDKDDDIKYLELYWCDSISKWEDEEPDMHRPLRMEFHGRGKPGEDDIKYGWNKDEYINYGVSFTPACDLASYPIKINTAYEVWEDDYTKSPKGMESLTKVVPGCICIPSIFEVLYGIIWELSWNGDPKSRDNRAADLSQAAKEIEDGTAELIPADEVFKDLENKIEAKKSKKDDSDGTSS